MANNLDLFEEFLIRQKRDSLIMQALTDKSHKAEATKGVSNSNPEEIADNSKLATLGDAVLRLCLTDVLYEQDKISEERQKYESDEFLVTVVAKRYNLLNYIKKDRGNEKLPDDYDYCKQKKKGKNRHKYIATAVEAMLGAIYLKTKDIVSLTEMVRAWVKDAK
jgi:dsRNA-specific ribonuclease